MGDVMMAGKIEINGKTINVNGLDIFYLESGKGSPVVLLHGWPTSSYLWRNIIPSLAKTRRVIAPDLIGYGRSDKPLDIIYSLDNQSKILGEFLDGLGLNKTALVVHDFGGPIGMLWAVRNPEKLERLAILNTFLHPRLPFFMALLFLATRIPGVDKLFATPWGVATTIKLGISNKEALTKELIEAYQAPFKHIDAQKALQKAFNDTKLNELNEVIQRLPALEVPIFILYGENDIWLAPEMIRIKNELPNAHIRAIPECSHFLQEDQPEIVSELLVEFFSK
ncbi:MAG: alpha/beta fold hydrolase [Candidatus Methanoperedens sp.]|nr:alpha/beta fold hydrolase [Candidatus Methanoperedens sp.]